MSLTYLGEFHVSTAPRGSYWIPRKGFQSLTGLRMALLHAINFDRQQRGWRPVTHLDLPLPVLRSIPEEHWKSWEPRCVLCFTLGVP